MEKTVFLAECGGYQKYEVRPAVLQVLNFFLLERPKLVAEGKKVLLKPNLVMSSGPETAATTHPQVVAAVAEFFLDRGCQVTIADSCGGLYNAAVLKKLYQRTGMEEAAQKTGAGLNFDTQSRTIGYAPGKTAHSFPIIQPVLDADIIINLGKLKTHGLTYYTGAVKNLFGVIPGLTKPVFHSRYPRMEDFCSMLVDLCECVKPHFSIIDGIIGMEGHGPTGGNPKAAKVLIGSTNPHAADLAAIQIMGFHPEQVPTILEAQKRGLIPGSYKELTLLGTPIKKLETRFLPSRREGRKILKFLPRSLRPGMEDLLAPYPIIQQEKCIGCGDCVRTCPQNIITISKNKKAVIHYQKCIRCYCCQELCRKRAIQLKRKLRRP